MTFKHIKQLNQRLKTHQIAAFAGQMAYFFVLSFFPLVIFIVSIVSKLNINYSFAAAYLHNIVPDNIQNMIFSFIHETVHVEGNTLLSISGIAMLYASSRSVSALQRAVNTSYGVEETRNFIFLKLIGMFYTLMFTLMIVLSITIPSLVGSILSSIMKALDISLEIPWIGLLGLIRNLVLFSTFAVVITSIYTLLPNKKMHLLDIYPGALFAIIGSILGNFVFTKMVIGLTDYSILYGSLSAMIAFMIWVYFLGLVIIIGAEINAMHFENRKP